MNPVIEAAKRVRRKEAVLALLKESAQIQEGGVLVPIDVWEQFLDVQKHVSHFAVQNNNTINESSEQVA